MKIVRVANILFGSDMDNVQVHIDTDSLLVCVSFDGEFSLRVLEFYFMTIYTKILI